MKDKGERKAKTIVGILLLVISIIVLIGLGIACGFYQQTIATGFVPDALLFIGFMLSIVGLGVGVFILTEVYY